MRSLSRLKRANRFLPPTLLVTFVAAGCLVAPAMAAAEPTIQTSTTITCGGKIRFPDTDVQCLVRTKSSGVGATAATGTVRFTAEGGPISASCTLVALIGPESACQGSYKPHIAGQLTVNASYLGDQTHLPSSGKTTVPVSDTVTSLTCQPESPAVGEASTCTAEVKSFGPASDNVSGTVSFSAGGEGQQLEPNSCTLGEGNACSVNFSPRAGGVYLVTATYEGDATHPASHAEATVVARGATETTVSCGSRLRFPDTDVQCLVRTKSSGVGATAATGIVRLSGEGRGLTECRLVQFLGPESVAQCGFSPKEGGLQTITAHYPGDQTHLPSSGKTTVPVSDTVTSLTCQPESPAVGEASTCTAEVKNAGAASDNLSGILSFKSDHEGRFEPSSCSVDENNICTVRYFPAVGADHRITATYEGDATHPASHGEATLAVRGTSVKLLCTQQSEALYEPASCVARVVNTGLGSRSLTGKVRFTSSTDGTFSSPECTLVPFVNNDGGFCATAYTPEAAGVNVIRAFYSGDDAHPPATDGKSQVNALARPTTTTVACTGSPLAGNTECVVHVRDNTTFRGTAPTGGIEWFSAEERDTRARFTCLLKPVNSVESSCSFGRFNYDPKVLTTQLLFARYPGVESPPVAIGVPDKVHAPSEATIRLIYPTTTEVDCGDSAVVGELKVCTVTVRVNDIEPRPSEGGPTVPTGPVRFSSPAMGMFSQTECTLATIGADASACSVSYRPQAPGSHAISASYGGDLKHDPSFDTKDLVARSG
jgi:hypothetical protein